MSKYKMTMYVRLATIFMIFAFASIFTISCDDDPISPQSEHFEAIGMYISSSGMEIASILRGETDDTLYAVLGELTDHMDAQFYDEDENIVDPPDDEDSWLSWEIDDENIVEVWQHEGEEGGFEFHLRGLQEGQTNIEFMIMHVDHADFRSGKIPVVTIVEE